MIGLLATMTRKYRYFFLLSIFSLSVFAQPEKYEFHRYTTKDGLTQSYVFSILQDNRGFMWFGTWDGLNLFDGFNFISFKPDAENPNSLSSNCVTTIYEDRYGKLCIGTNGGGLSILPQSSYMKQLINWGDQPEKPDWIARDPIFINYRNDINNAQSLGSNNVTCMCEDDFGNLWVGTYGGGLTKIFQDSNGIKAFKQYRTISGDPNSLVDNNIKAIAKDRYGIIWVGTYGNGLVKVHPNNGKDDSEVFVNYRNKPSDPFSLANDKVTCIMEDVQGALWIGTRGGGLSILSNLDREKNELKFENHQLITSNANSLSNNNIESIYQDLLGTIWLGTSNGLNRVTSVKGDYKNIQFTRIFSDRFNEFSLSDNHIASIYQDKSGMLWVGTYNGINKLNLYPKQFVIHKSDPAQKNSLIDGRVNVLFKSKNDELWIGDESGIVTVYDKTEAHKMFLLNNGMVTSLTPELQESLRQRMISFLQFPGISAGSSVISGNFINSINEDHDGNIWLGGVGLYKFTPGKGFKYYFPGSSDENSVGGWAVWSTITDAQGDVWIATSNGLDKYVKETNTFLHFRHKEKDKKSISSNVIYTLFVDSKERIWVGTDSGLCLLMRRKINVKEQNDVYFISYRRDNTIENTLSSEKIWSIAEDKKGIFWLGTEGGGLVRMELDVERNAIYKTYNRQSGLPSNILCGVICDNNNTIWISSTAGLTCFNQANETFKNYGEWDGLQADEFRKGSYFKAADGMMFFGGMKGFNSFYPDSIRDNPFLPKVVITDFKIFNRSVPIGKSIDKVFTPKEPIGMSSEITLSYNEDVISFEFVALHFLESERNKYAYKMDGFEDKWNYTTSAKRFASYTNLPPGKYIFKVKASNADGVWNENGASLRIIVRPPFWLTWWAYLVYIILMVLGIWGIINYSLSKERIRSQYELAKLESVKKDEMAEKSREVDQMKLRFFTNISHEFKTPLTLIIGPVENLLKESSASRAVRQQALLIQRNAKHLLRLVNQLMDFRKLEIGSMQIKVQSIDIVKFINRVMSNFRYMAHQRNINFHFRHDTEDVHIWFDQDMLEKIIYNILSNAFKFTPEGGEISLKLLKQSKNKSILDSLKTKSDNKYAEGFIELIIRDNGKGIKKDKLEKIFDRFYQVENFKGEGSGIGLALARELVELHQGEVFADSEAGEYSCFTVRIPLGSKHILSEHMMDEATTETVEERRSADVTPYLIDAEPVDAHFSDHLFAEEDQVPLVLVVEDNADLRTYVRTSLSHDYRVVDASNGMDGLEKAKEIIPDLILTDIMMPDMDGLELCKKIREELNTSHIPVILLTALSSDEARIEGLKAGADDYITKPFNYTELQLRVKNIIESRKRLRDTFGAAIILGKTDELPQADHAFILRAISLIENNLNDANFSVEDFSNELGLSRAQLYRKVKGATGQTVSEFVRAVRLKKAGEMIKAGELTMNEIMYKVGFNSQSYFTKCFKSLFGISPSDFASLDNQAEGIKDLDS